jgi:hypothetical protein
VVAWKAWRIEEFSNKAFLFDPLLLLLLPPLFVLPRLLDIVELTEQLAQKSPVIEL